MTNAEVPFWQRKRLNEMTDAEWESLCDGCGRCCLEKLAVDDSPDVYPLDIGCPLLDPTTARCTDYDNRLEHKVGCFKVTAELVPIMPWLPPTCGYLRVHRGQPLDWWHPLVSGDPSTVAQAGVRAAGRFVTRKYAGALEYHTVDWPSRDVTEQPRDQWIKAMYGGINAAVPTPFGPDRSVDLGLMAAHCFWLLENGCHGLMVLDKVGEVASLSIADRIAVLQGLAARGVPVSKILAGIGPASAADGVLIAAAAAELGIRGMMLSVSVAARAVPHDVLPPATLALIAAIQPDLHLYLSLAAHPTATAACITALQALPTGRLRGIRDESAGAPLGLAALSARLGEVYATDDAALPALLEQGGAGLISPAANVLSRLDSQFIKTGTLAPRARQAIEAVTRLLGAAPPAPSIKALLARHTGYKEWEQVRLPLRPLPAPEKQQLFNAFDASGLRLQPATRAIVDEAAGPVLG